MKYKVSPKNRIDEKFLNNLFSKDGFQRGIDGIRQKKYFTEVERYFDNIYYNWETVINNKLRNVYKERPEVQKIINLPDITSSQKLDLLYKFVYDIEKVKFDKEYKDAYEYFEHFFSKTKFEEIYKKYNSEPEIQSILNDTTIRSDYKNKLILIKMFEILVKDFKDNPTFEKLYLKLGNRIEDEFKSANDFFKNKFKYSGELDYSTYMQNLLNKHKKDNIIKEIYEKNGLSQDTKTMLSIIYLKYILDVPSEENIEELIKGSIDKISSFSIYIPYLLNKDELNKKLNADYYDAQQYFVSKYSLNESQKLDSLIARYKDHPNIVGIIEPKQLLVSLKQIDEEETKVLMTMKKLINDYYPIISLNQIIQDNSNRYLQQFDILAFDNKFEYKGFNIYRPTLDSEVQKIIKAYLIYKGETERIKNEKNASAKAKKDAEDAIIKRKEEEINKEFEDNLDQAYKESLRYFEITYPNTQYERNKRLSKLEDIYYKQLIYIVENGIMINNYFYTDLESNNEHLIKAKMIFLYRKELENSIIENNYRIAMKYFKNRYPQDYENKIKEIEGKHGYKLNRYYDYYYLPTQELIQMYKTYKYYLYDDYNGFLDIWRSIKGYIDYYGTVFTYIIDRYLLQWIYYLYDTYRYIVDMRWWYYPKYIRNNVTSVPAGLSETEKLIKENTNALINITAVNKKVTQRLNDISKRSIRFKNSIDNINIGLKNLKSSYDKSQKYLSNVVKGSAGFANNVINKLASISNSLESVNDTIQNINEDTVKIEQLEDLKKVIKDLSTSMLNLSSIMENSRDNSNQTSPRGGKEESKDNNTNMFRDLNFGSSDRILSPDISVDSYTPGRTFLNPDISIDSDRPGHTFLNANISVDSDNIGGYTTPPRRNVEEISESPILSNSDETKDVE